MVVNPLNLVRKLVSLPHPLLAAIDDYRFKSRIKTESEAIRCLVELGLSSVGTPFHVGAISLHWAENEQNMLLRMIAERGTHIEVLISTDRLRELRDNIEEVLKALTERQDRRRR